MDSGLRPFDHQFGVVAVDHLGRTFRLAEDGAGDPLHGAVRKTQGYAVPALVRCEHREHVRLASDHGGLPEPHDVRVR